MVNDVLSLLTDKNDSKNHKSMTGLSELFGLCKSDI